MAVASKATEMTRVHAEAMATLRQIRDETGIPIVRLIDNAVAVLARVHEVK